MKKERKGQCRECPEGTERVIVKGWSTRANKLCQEHAWAEKKEKRKKRPRIQGKLTSKSRGIPTQISETLREIREKDRAMYARIWNTRPHYCENCGMYLGEFMKYAFMSHVLTKKAHPELRHDPNNINLLCSRKEMYEGKCHEMWETGKRTLMPRIFLKNYPYMVNNGYVPTEEEEKFYREGRNENIPDPKSV